MCRRPWARLLASWRWGEGDPKETAILAANLSGDADTIGAIACAMAGAYAGFDAIPAADVAVLENDSVFQAYDVPAQSPPGWQR